MDIAARSLKVLIVEDHFLSRQMITVALREKGVTNLEATSDGKQAIASIENARIEGRPFHIIFLDWEMPIMNGIDVLKYFRANPDYVNTAFIMVTAVAEQKLVMDAVKSGATGYVVKPVSQNGIAKKFDEIHAWIKARPNA
jgi:two-component system chemotaxis response regulator CheY